MSYTITQLPDEAAYRALYLATYCVAGNPITTIDGMPVDFYPTDFDHCFFESANRATADKSVFSQGRAERILWIKDALEDPTADFYQGWVKKTKSYVNSRRVTVVKGDYVVVLLLKPNGRAKIITAYVADNSIGKIRSSPRWVK